MKRIPLKQEQVPEFLHGATELRVPVRPQPEGKLIAQDPGGALFSDYWKGMNNRHWKCPYPVGSELALTETWSPYADENTRVACQEGDILLGYNPLPCVCKADYDDDMRPLGVGGCETWSSAATMPAEFSRFKRRVVAVTVEHGKQWEWVLTLEEVKHG